MAQDQFSIPACVGEYLKGRGYAADSAMYGHISAWWGWYTGDVESDGEAKDFYEVAYTDSKSNERKRRRRLSLRPARRACREWASLLLNEDTEVSAADEAANGWLRGFLDSSEFWAAGQELVEVAFALGTGAWALWFDVGDGGTEIKLRTYDARMVIPLTWDADGVAECAFCTRASLRGKQAYQLQMHVRDPDTGTYAIETAVFIDGEEADPEEYGAMPRFDTLCPTPTFGIVRPGIRNTCADLSPFGQSVFHDGIDTVKAVDTAWDALVREVDLTGVMVFMDEALIDVRDENGRAVPVPADGGGKFRKVAGQAGSDFYEVYSPAIRADPLVKALGTALAEYGDQMGFGQDYFTLDKAGGLKTATEVSADNSQLMRNVRKHENALGRAVKQVLGSLLTCASVHCGAPFGPDHGGVEVFFDDSIITDTQADKNQMMAEIAAGIAQPWEFRAKFYGESPEEAQAACAGPDAYGGFDLAE